jgi:hypothetical protein
VSEVSLFGAPISVPSRVVFPPVARPTTKVARPSIKSRAADTPQYGERERYVLRPEAEGRPVRVDHIKAVG